MRTWQLLAGLVFGLILSGCDVSALAIDGKEGGSVLEVADVTIDRDALTSNLALMKPNTAIRVGQKLNTALVGDYRKPTRGVTLKELPPGVSADFEGLGWETAERSVNLVGLEEDIILALDLQSKSSAEDREQAIERYKFVYGDSDAIVKGETAEYWFWEDGPVRLMVCSVKVSDSRFRLTSVLGLKSVMDRLRMDQDSATRDVAAARQIALESAESDTK